METKKNRGSELELIKGTLLRRIDSEGMRLMVCLLATFLLGLAAHGYGLLNFTINHDSLHEFYRTAAREWKFSIGRFMVPILNYLMGEIIVLPWSTGLAGLLFAGLAAHLISKMFTLDTVWENIAVSGICVTNAVVCTIIASYLHDFAGDMLALLLACYAAYAWSQMRDRLSWKHTLAGAAALCMSFGFYQAYLAVMITLLCMDSILELLRGAQCRTVIQRLSRAVPMGVLAVAGYVVCAALARRITGAPVEQQYDIAAIDWSLSTVIWAVKSAYTYAVTDLFVPNYGRILSTGAVQAVFHKTAGVICLFNAAFLLYVMAVLVTALRKKAVKRPEFLMILALILLLPACMMSVSLVSYWKHHLIRYAVYLYPLLPLLVLKYSRERGILRGQNWQQAALAAMTCVILCSNIQMSNTAYVKRDLERQAALSTMTRVVDRLEQYEGYTYNESTVAIVGKITRNDCPVEVGAVKYITGLDCNSPITNKMKLKYYFDVFLQYPLNLCPDEKETEIVTSEAFKAMPRFPEKGCVATINGVVVVKMDERSLYYDGAILD